MGTADARPAAEGSVRNRPARRHDGGLPRSARSLFRNTKRTTLWLKRRREDLGENPGGPAGGRLRQERCDRRAARPAEAEINTGCSSPPLSCETAHEERREAQADVMSVTFQIPGPLRSFAGGRSQ